MRPIVLATDYGIAGPYVGQLKSAIYKISPNALIIDLIHDLPAFNPKASAYLLASYLEHMPENSIIVGVVDPGVGSDREPIILEGNGFTFIGPNNGMFSIVARKLVDIKLSKIIVTEKSVSKTFHGRDIFAPVAAKIVSNLENKLEPLEINKFVGTDWPDNLFEIIYIDHYGNAVTGIKLNRTFDANKVFIINDYKISYKKAFFCANENECFWFCNSSNLLEIATKQSSAKNILKLSIGAKIKAI
ncbi:MAG: SAM hydrolase/SAM-dependent halogenase family protein [Gammaproteobacteria bacterium]